MPSLLPSQTPRSNVPFLQPRCCVVVLKCLIFGRYESQLKADSHEVKAAAAAASKGPGGFRVKRGDIEKAFNRAVAFENQMEQIIIDEQAEAAKQHQLPAKSTANAVDKLGQLVEKERGAQMAAISAALQQVQNQN
jgi:hypothetical protein